MASAAGAAAGANDECPVCRSAFTGKVRRPVTCQSCGERACTPCYQTYLLGSALEPHCLFCRHVWPDTQLRTHFSASWCNGPYKNHRGTVLLAQERLQLDSALQFIQHKRDERELQDELNRYKSEVHRVEVLLHRLQRRRVALREGRPMPVEPRGDPDQQDEKKQEPVARQAKLTLHCPKTTCTGWLSSSTRYRCSVCAIRLCSECHATLPEAEHSASVPLHVCRDSDRESVALLLRECKPCPSCHVLTFRIEGCHQMWCVMCKTAWSWTTGRLIQGVIHNPHYFAFLREQAQQNAAGAPGAPEQDAIGQGCMPNRDVMGRISHHIRRRALVRGQHTQEPVSELLQRWIDMQRLWRQALHLREITLPRCDERPMRRDLERFDWRVSVVAGELTEEQWLTKLRRSQKQVEWKTQLHQMLDAAITSLTDTLTRAVFQAPLEPRNDEDGPVVNACLTSLSTLVAYVNEQLGRLAKQFQQTRWYLTPQWVWTSSAQS